MKHANLLVLLGLFIVQSHLFSQNYLGITQSNYAGVMGLDVQPASFVDSRFKFDMNLASFDFNFYQNAFAFDTKDMPKWWNKSFSPQYNAWTQPDSTFFDRYMIRQFDENSKKNIGIYNNIQVDLLNFAFHINRNIAIGFTIKARSILNVDNIDPTLGVLAQEGLDYPSLWNAQFNNQLLTMNQMSWLQYGINYGQIIKQDGEHFMKAGGTLKFNSGITSAYLYTDNFDYNLFNKDTSMYLKGDFEYGYSENLDPFISGDSKEIPFSTSKLGLGLDLGFVYEWRPDWKEYKYDMDGKTNLWRRSQEKYKIRAGASILDIGGMKFTKGGFSQDFSVNTSNLFNLRVFDKAKGLASFDSVIDSLILNDAGWSAGSGKKTYYMNTPTALSLQLDYHIWKWFYVNATGMINLVSKKDAHKVHIANQISLTPSFDYAWFGFGIPMSMNRYSGFKAGIATRLGPVTVGVTDFRTLFATGKVRGGEFYFGLRIPIVYTEPDDQDNDKVSDKKDKCKTVPGVWAFQGCPDTDGDGIKDTEDDCPEVAGLAKFKGCPDRDNDSIIDKLDKCPDDFGLAKFGGCPDRDNDSIIDMDDACPDDAGPVALNGCPDTDKDGIIDAVDYCPNEYGVPENNGCPWPDTDGDGLLDKDDACPQLAGPLANKGCPYIDTDKDGVLDKDDECPGTPGTIANKGCPEITQEVQEILKTAFDNLEFESGKDIILAGSFNSLDELAKVLVKKSTWELEMEGHTDNVGNDQKNLILSQKRAEAVKAYLVSKGVDAKRLHAYYYGEMKPIADNATEEGRQKNRRVEMKIKFD